MTASAPPSAVGDGDVGDEEAKGRSVRRGLRGGAWHRLEAIRPKPGGDRRRLSCVGQRTITRDVGPRAGRHWVPRKWPSFPDFVAHGPERPAALRNCNGEVRTVTELPRSARPAIEHAS